MHTTDLTITPFSSPKPHRVLRRQPTLLQQLSALLVTLLIIISLVFDVLAVTDSDWAHRDLLFTDDEDNNYNLRIPRSPFVNCIAVIPYIPHPPVPTFAALATATGSSSSSSSTSMVATSSTTPPSSLASQATPPTPTDHYFLNCSEPLCDLSVSDNPHLCQQLSLSRGFIYASLALISAAVLLSTLLFVVLNAAVPSRLRHHQRARFASTISFFSFITHSVLLASVATMLLVHYLGWSAAVDQQIPNGNSITQTSVIPPNQLPPTAQLGIPWVAGQANLWLALGWFFAALGAVGWAAVWGVGSLELDGRMRRWRGGDVDADANDDQREQSVVEVEGRGERLALMREREEREKVNDEEAAGDRLTADPIEGDPV